MQGKAKQLSLEQEDLQTCLHVDPEPVLPLHGALHATKYGLLRLLYPHLRLVGALRPELRVDMF